MILISYLNKIKSNFKKKNRVSGPVIDHLTVRTSADKTRIEINAGNFF